MPARHFAWRFQGNSLFFYNQIAEKKPLPGPIIATSMVNLAVLKGLYPSLSQSSLLLYHHENQFAYPDRYQEGQAERKLTSIYNGLAADSIAFNSSFNRDTFLDGAGHFLESMPDFKEKGIIQELKNKSGVIPVPIVKESRQVSFSPLSDGLRIVWNHRWEYDKDPEALFYFLKHLYHSDINFEISIIGPSFRKVPPIFKDIKENFHPVISHWGYIEDRDHYQSILQNSNIAFSTAKHEFQGIALQEAISLNCIPLAPNALAYPEFIDPSYLYENSDDSKVKGERAFLKLQQLIKGSADLPPIELEPISLTYLSKAYKTWVTDHY